MALVPPVPDPREPGSADDPGGGDSRPLTQRERHFLADLEARAAVDDPRFCARMGRVRPALVDRVSPRALNLSIQALVLLVLAVLVLPGAWLGVLVTILVLVVPAVAAMYLIRRGHL